MFDFADFVDEVAREVAASVEPWRLRVGEAVARWSAEGVDVAPLEAALRLDRAPDVDALLGDFERAVERARTPVVPVPVAVPEPVIVSPPAAPASPPNRASLFDPESWVVEWTCVADFLVDDWS